MIQLAKSIVKITAAVILTSWSGTLNAQWSLTGNAGTSPGVNYLGTSDNKELKIKTNNVERLHIGTDGFIGIGTTSPIEGFRFGINVGGLMSNNGMYLNTIPTTIWNVTYTPRPTYGYAINGVSKGFHCLDNGNWKLNLNGNDRFIVEENGDVGIGVMNPTQRLDVDGGAKFAGPVTASGSISGTSGSFTGGLSTNGNVTFNGVFPQKFTVKIDADFQASLDVDGTLDGQEIFGHTTSSAPGVRGNAVLNHPSLVSYGVFGSYNSSPDAYGVVCQGTGYYTGNWYQWSDRKLKKDVSTMDDAIERIMMLKPKTYSYDVEKYAGYGLPEGKQMGFIAQEVSEVFPELTKTTTHHQDPNNPDGKQLEVTMVNYIGLIPVLTKAIQEQESKIEEQQQQLNEQAIRLERLEKLLGVAPAIEDKSADPSTGKLNKLFAPVPNPTTGETELAFEVDGNVSNVMIVVRDMSGKSVASFPISARGKSSITLQLNSLSSGVYTCELVVDGKVTDNARVVKTN